MTPDEATESRIIQAAGGLLWRQSAQGPELALVHRPRYDDWTLPKGKVDDGESWPAAALREVAEETGCQARLGAFAGCACYSLGDAAKIVLFWHMHLVEQHPFVPNDETDALRWLPPAAAAALLSYDNERTLLNKVAATDYLEN
ncbi:MAG: NUDIX hydrolase [Chloroflexi bacterium]|nr:NUDIX hydrolase [Chloroflexota bacterium]MCI0577987.1 NUDIX hydrolase [Chloroflexota bacterium]MCI0648097.1 NUDIX hydrolase [Chloroflexota bacterium]